MENVNLLTAFLGWCSVINGAILLISAVCVLGFRDLMHRVHCELLELPPAELNIIYAKFLAYYEIFWLFFNLAPYIALKLLV